MPKQQNSNKEAPTQMITWVQIPAVNIAHTVKCYGAALETVSEGGRPGPPGCRDTLRLAEPRSVNPAATRR